MHLGHIRATGTPDELKLIATAFVVILGSAFFSCLSMTTAGLALKRDRLMGIGQAITMPLFFSSSALYRGWPSRRRPGDYRLRASPGIRRSRRRRDRSPRGKRAGP